MTEYPQFTGDLPYFPDRTIGTESAANPFASVPSLRRPVPDSSSFPTRQTVLFAWELGAGFGHLLQMLPLAEDLVRRGHRVFVAFRELDRAGPIYARAGVSFLQAPIWLSGGLQFPRPVTFSQMLANVGFAGDAAVFARACAWRNLIQQVRPDLLVADHAPTALLASRGLPMRRALIGSGFCCPPDLVGGGGDEPWAVVRPQQAAAADRQTLLEDERHVLGRLNRVLEKWKQPPLERIGQLYSQVDENSLTTLPELDHFPDRRGAGYWGPVVTRVPGGEPPQWPDARGKRVFVYVKDSAAEAMLAALAEAGHSTVAYIDGATSELSRRLESPTVHVASRPLDLGRAAAECDAAVLGGGHGTTAEMLLAGKPVLQIPPAREQRMVAEAVTRLGAGLDASARQPGSVRAALAALLSDDRYGAAARRFADRYARFRPQRQREAMLTRAEELLEARP